MATVMTVVTCCWGAAAIYHTGRWVGWIFRNRRAGELLLDASRNLPYGKIIYWLVLLGLSLSAFIYLQPHRLDYGITQAIILNFYLLTNRLTEGKLELRERGLVHAGTLIPWDQIRSWAWDTRLGGMVVLNINRRRRELVPLWLPVRLHVDVSQEDAIERVMNEHVSERNSDRTLMND